MTQKEILEKLIPYYENAVRELQHIDGKRVYCLKNEIWAGICNCADKIFKVDLYKEHWVWKHTTAAQWCKFPIEVADCHVISILQFRIDKMKMILNELT